ncbi:MAG: hypothetical protein WAL10_10315 [Acetobacteraceae bacterium]
MDGDTQFTALCAVADVSDDAPVRVAAGHTAFAVFQSATGTTSRRMPAPLCSIPLRVWDARVIDDRYVTTGM